ncbi:ribose operon transcriptional repressor RbsR [Tolumonas osonensis]|uniref:Ribose operon repressor n=1 Tax=Tolumonas osonensis TaxID=675874 RepID=A0A841GGE0_9GAMM|nr:ribose operon transcriptional repressor RbsR [Tolumonas osonensis]MBB6054321.1 LacI family transcriptional regulator [Tolumonas osonensis]
MATMKDVARLAGVSTSTVSHVVNSTRFVSDEIRERILKAVAELNYSPSALARSLKINQTRTLGMMVTTSNNPFFAEVVAGVERICYQRGYTLVLCNTEGDPERLRHNLEVLLQKRIDGLLLMCTEGRSASAEVFGRHPAVPTVVMDWGPLNSQADRIQDNSALGGYLATRHLIEQGHRRIGLISGPIDKLPAQSRQEGYRRALTEAGLPYRQDYVVTGDFEFAGGISGMQQLLALPEPPTAVFAGNDVSAVGVYQALYRAGLRVPQDISVIGYDDIELARYLTPPLTTIHQPQEELCRQAVDILLDRIQGADDAPRLISLEPTLIRRESVSHLE